MSPVWVVYVTMALAIATGMALAMLLAGTVQDINAIREILEATPEPIR